MHHYRRGVRAAFQLGYRHGLFCAGCCWALMLIGFAAGVASLWWMAALTALMVYEKTARHGQIAVPVAGAVLLLWSALVFAHPWWLPAALSG
jgi:predicted metal-binding membrane protein